MKFKFVSLSVLTLLVSACASTPKIEPVIEEPIAPPPVATQEYIETTPYVDPMAGVPVQVSTAPIPGSLEDFLYNSGEDRVYFGYDSFDLNQASRNVLRRQADWLSLYTDVSVVMAGNADERGTREYNLALGARRADSAKTFLVSLGVNPRRLTTVSFGKERPIDARSNAEGWAKNRNVHTNLTSGILSGSAF